MGTLTSPLAGGISNFSSFMGGFVPLVNQVTQAVNMVKGVAGNSPEDEYRDQIRSQQGLALEQLKAQQGLQESQLAGSNALDKQRIALDAQQADEERRAALRRAVARQRSSFGAQGVASSGGGSSDAVLLGFFNESDAERGRREQLDQMRNSVLDQNLSDARSLNLLQATQLAERQKLARYYS